MKKIKPKKMWAVLLWGELQNPKHIFVFKTDAVNKRKELIEEPYHCPSCECEGLSPKEVRVVPITIKFND